MSLDRQTTFFTVADDRFFPGTVAMFNSLNLTGNSGKFIVLDQGLKTDQVRFLEQRATVIPITREQFGHPYLAKSYAFAHTLHPEGTIVVIDSDMIVTGSLSDIVSLAEGGKICVFPDYRSDRWFAEWEDIFSLPNRPRRQNYVNAGFLCFSIDRWPNFFKQWWEACRLIPPETVGKSGPEHPTWASDQDALNAVLMSLFPEDAIAHQPVGAEAYMGDFQRTRVIDRDRLVCELDGHPTLILHNTGSPKSWEPRAWHRVRRDAFTLLMRRSLVADDVPMKLAHDAIPIWLRSGTPASAWLLTIDLAHSVAAPPWRKARSLLGSKKTAHR
jgi:lipopolysaccharide biosynthesis glycosyltransferase